MWRPQILRQGLRKHRFKFRAELLKGIAVLARQVAVERLVQYEYRAPEHGRGSDGGKFVVRLGGSAEGGNGRVLPVTFEHGVSGATVRSRRNVFLVFVVPHAVARGLEVVVIRVPRVAPRRVLRRRRVGRRRGRLIGGGHCGGIIFGAASKKPGPPHSAQNGTRETRQAGIWHRGAPPQRRRRFVVHRLVKGDVRIDLFPECQA